MTTKTYRFTGLDNQTVFDKVVRHLRKQNRKSIHSHHKTICAYRGENNTSCAIGCLIADDEYDEQIEKRGVVFLDGIRGLTREHRAFYRELQLIHDGSFYPKNKKEFEKQVEHIAKKYGLVYPAKVSS